MAGRNILEVKQVTKSFGEKKVIHNLSLEMSEPEIYGLLGPSGAGKTTLVKMIAGIESPSDGEVYIFGERMPQLNLMARIGYMAQSDALYGELTAKENVQFFANLYGLSGKALNDRLTEVMKAVGLHDDLNKIVETYSGGMKRRLSLAIALIHKPKLIILDEPTVGVDPVLRQRIWETFELLKEEGISILVTTHVMDEAEKCDRLGMMRDGRFIAQGSSDELKERTSAETLEEAFLSFGSAAYAD